MTRDTLYAFAAGSDLAEVAEVLEARFTQFVGDRHWVLGQASIINHRHGKDLLTALGDPVRWDLGLMFELPDPAFEPPGWFADVDAIASFLGVLHDDFGRNFVISMRNALTGTTEHLLDVSTGAPDLGRLRAIMGFIDDQKDVV